MLMENLRLTNQVVIQFNLFPLSYSTADIEKSIFYEPRLTPFNAGKPFGEAKIMVVHGDVFTLEEDSIPEASIPLTEKSGLFNIIKLADESAP